MNNNTISVIIPIYNQANFVAEALESINNQTVKVNQIIVVDDGSTDNSVEVVNKFNNVTLIKKSHSGSIETIDEGLKIATGSIIGFLDADDRWTPNKTEVQIQLLAKNSDVDMLFGNCIRFQMMKTATGFEEKNIDVLLGICRGGGLFRKTVFDKVKYNTNDNTVHCFLDWYARAIEEGLKSMTHPEIVFHRRIHDKNQGIIEKDFQRQQYFNTLKALLDRRRVNENK